LPWLSLALGLGLLVHCGGSGSKKDPLPPVPAPTIQTQPQSLTADEGKMVTLSVVATGPDLTYTWRRNAVAIPGLSSATEYAFRVGASDNGSRYSVEISNAGGRVVSEEALLTVGAARVDLIQNGSFENLDANGSASSWTFSDSNMTVKYSTLSLAPIPGGGAYVLANGGWGALKSDSVFQTLTIPAQATEATLTFKLVILNTTSWTSTQGSPVNNFQVKLQDDSGTDLQTLLAKTDNDANVGETLAWNSERFDLSAFKGRTLRIVFASTQTDAAKDTAFVTDLVSLLVK
jgi:hypothetical protein